VVISSTDITVTSKSKSNEILPLWTKCWISTGLRDVDATIDKLSILAKVTHGNDPVLNADVWAYIERENEKQPIEIQLLDNGSGADNVGNDGLYSRYFTRYDGKKGRYTLRCKVKGTKDSSYVPGGDFVSRGQIRSKRDVLLVGPRAQPNGHVSAYPKSPGSTPICCGSDSGLSQLAGKSTGDFERNNNVGSFKVVNVPPAGTDTYPPNSITDLKVGTYHDNFLILNFTAPGDDYDYGKAKSYNLTYSYMIQDPENGNMSMKVTVQIKEADIISGSVDSPLEAGEKVVLVLQLEEIFNVTARNYNFRIHATDAAGNKGNPSNPATYCYKCEPNPNPPPSSGLSPGAIVGIVIGVIVPIVVVAVIIFVVMKKKKGEEIKMPNVTHSMRNINIFKKNQSADKK